MSTVQIALRDRRYGAALADLLQKDGTHDVVFVDSPNLEVDGVIVVDGARPENLLLFETEPERFVVVTSNDKGILFSVWDAGVRHVVFEGDPPVTAFLAVAAAELRTPRPPNVKNAASAKFPKYDLSARTRLSFPHPCKPLP